MSMNSTTVYIKTPQGQDEIATRARQLSARPRAVLILVDGRRNVAELMAQSQAPAETESHLAALLEAGLIAAVPQAAPAPAPAPARALDIPAIKDFICVTLHQSIGPDADMFTVRVEAAANLPELLQQAEKVREVIRAAAGSKKADQYWEKLATMLA